VERAKQDRMRKATHHYATNCLRVFAISVCIALTNACAQPGGEAPEAKIKAAAGEPVPTSVEQARTECWMRYEGPKQVKNLDEKMKLVDKCIDEKMKLLPAAANR